MIDEQCHEEQNPDPAKHTDQAHPRGPRFVTPRAQLLADAVRVAPQPSGLLGCLATPAVCREASVSCHTQLSFTQKPAPESPQRGKEPKGHRKQKFSLKVGPMVLPCAPTRLWG